MDIMPSYVTHGSLQGQWSRMHYAKKDCPLFYGYEPIIALMNTSAPTLIKIIQIAKEYRDLADFACCVLSDTLSEQRYRAGCITEYDREQGVRAPFVQPSILGPVPKIMYFEKTRRKDGAEGGQEGTVQGEWVASRYSWHDTPNLYLILDVKPGCSKHECARARERIMRRTSENWISQHIDSKGFLAKFCPMPKYEMVENVLSLREWRAFWVSVASNKVPYIPGLEPVGGMGYQFPSLLNGNGGA